MAAAPNSFDNTRQAKDDSCIGASIGLAAVRRALLAASLLGVTAPGYAFDDLPEPKAIAEAVQLPVAEFPTDLHWAQYVQPAAFDERPKGAMPRSSIEIERQGHHGVGHSEWHGFYESLRRPDSPKTSCCNDRDCRPTVQRTVEGRYEVKVKGVWREVPMGLVVKKTAPDHGAHVCASDNGTIWCVVLAPES
jgi:hypothetical protein